MNKHHRHSILTGVVWGIATLVLSSAAGGVFAAGEAAVAASSSAWMAREPREIRAEVQSWVAQQNLPDAIRADIDKLWSDFEQAPNEPDVLLRLSATFALADARARKLLELCSKPYSRTPLARQAWLFDANTAPLLSHNLRLLYGRYLIHEGLWDEAVEPLSGLAPASVADPASLLFYQAVLYHGLLDRRQGLATLERLLANTQQCPQRYVSVARLMQQDLEELEDDTLDHIARRMDDIRRRLDLGRGGPKVRKIQDGVIESLDKLIKELEDEERRRQQQAAAGAGGSQSSRPAEESRILGGKGPGEVTPKNIGSKSGWGNLPPKQREEAMQQVGRDFPSHYREVIEQYFKKLANEKGD